MLSDFLELLFCKTQNDRQIILEVFYLVTGGPSSLGVLGGCLEILFSFEVML
jgi:hypothetical protein